MISQKVILIVEDNKINRIMLENILAEEYRVLEAENGLQALDVLKCHRDEISLILLDIVMPVMDGYTFLSIVKKDPDYSSIPVIVTTQNDNESDEVAALSHGATDFVAKPYKPQIILHRVASIINLRETAAMINQFKYDRLTGLFSKEFFYQRAKEVLLGHPETRYDIVCSNIENFKLINDIFGSRVGDRLLCAVADLFAQRVGNHGFCGRLNADQFICMFEHLCEYTDDLFQEAGNYLNTLTSAKNVVMKWGIYAVKDRTTPVEQMCDRALLAARSIKGQYGKYFAFYDDRLRNKLLREQAITDGMEAALAEHQFFIVLQPKFSISDNRLAGAEALVRWNHPEWGIQPPSEFIPLFEKNGFITRLDQYVWEQACQVLRNWEDRGYPLLPISVNVSRADIYNTDLADFLSALIKKYRVAPSALHLEITESAYTENPSQIIETVTRLRQLGFVIEMDDFGSGYSSLNMLNRMPLDILKLDMKFIQSETVKPGNQGILRFIMGLARWMNLKVVAEGVETQEQLERLLEIGCDYVQGYYFARPMPTPEVETLIQRQIQETEMPVDSREDIPDRPVLMLADENEEERRRMRRVFDSSFYVVEADSRELVMTGLVKYRVRLAGIILSLTLPGELDFTLLKTLVQEKTMQPLVVIAAAPWDPETEERALALGADDFAARPHTPVSLKNRVLHASGITAWRKKEMTLQNEACRDYLTGLLNRRGMDAAVRALTAEEGPLAFCLFDLDNLKQINDHLGHRSGDQLILQFSELLRSYSRPDDILVRFGGDEFIAIFKQIGSADNAARKGAEICQAFQGHQFAGQHSVSVSAGIVYWDQQETCAEMLARADQALYAVKSEKKGGYSLWKA